MLEFVSVAIGAESEAGCVSCVNCGATGAGIPLPLDSVRAALLHFSESWSSGPGPNVVFTGLEPFAHPELPALIAAARAAGFVRIRLRTDAGALGLGSNARGALDAGVTQIEVVCLGDGVQMDRLAGKPGLAAAQAAGVAAFRTAAREAEAVVTVIGLVPVCRHNAALVPGAVARLASLGAVAVHLDAAGCPPRERAHVIAALDTAAVNGIAGSVSGLEDEELEAPWRIAPSRLKEVPR